MKRQAVVALVGIGLYFFLHGVAKASLPVVINVSGSMPRGVYWKEKRERVAVGDLVLVCPSSKKVWDLIEQSKYVIRGSGCGGELAPLIKRVVAVENDFVSVREEGVFVNDVRIKRSAPKSHSSRGNPLFHAPSGRVEAGRVFLLGSSSESLDSRYVGTFLVTDVKATLLPLFG